MKLRLVKQGDFLGTKCDFYVDEENNIYMSRTQIGYALQYKQPQNAITIIHKRYPELLTGKSVEVDRVNLTPRLEHHRNNEKVFMYNEKGIYAIIRKSNQPIADKYFDWVYDVIESIRENGYYIASEKDSKWLGVREETKKVRKMETDSIKKFVAYAKAQGSTHADKYYSNFTQLVHKKLGVESGGRDKVNQETLLRLKSLETLIDMRLETLMKNKIPYKEVYQEVKNFLDAI